MNRLKVLSDSLGRSISQLKPDGNLEFGKHWVGSSLVPRKDGKRNYALHGFGNGSERYKEDGKGFSFRHPGTRDIRNAPIFKSDPNERSHKVKKVIDGFEAHCNPKKNETARLKQ